MFQARISPVLGILQIYEKGGKNRIHSSDFAASIEGRRNKAKI